MNNKVIVNKQGEKQKKSFIKELSEWVFTMGGTILVTLFLLANVFAFTGIEGDSMEPTFYNKERIFNFKLIYMLSEPKNGDIVILSKEKSKKGIINNMITEGKDVIINLTNMFNKTKEVKYIIKRVVAVEGDTLDIREGYVYLNDEKIKEDYIKGKTFERSDFSYPITIPKDHVFVLGDNRGNSLDSRDLGLIHLDQIKGKVFFRIWPIERFGKVN